ncbi:hypothetical protein EDD18DRAFT_1348621 [Armillaria luteobubalina]|uniref:Uncharacterized protein n=1 Tax=Armillaria luteobubalina TaxID=153913 RepID=A0AA39QE26_9AGAR|nr:hypothetical protein EDD18DRAFT_1348621 [Armillaria luteobubalina]
MRSEEEHPALDWEDLWTRLDECLTSSKMASLERVVITFDPEPVYWNILKAEMGVNFLGLKKLGRENQIDSISSLSHLVSFTIMGVDVPFPINSLLSE